MNYNEKEITIELQLFIDKLGHFPKITDFNSNNMTSLLNTIHRSGKGLTYFQLLLGYTPNRRPVSYWENNIDQELSELIRKIGKFPSAKEFQANGKIGLYRAIKSTGSSLNEYREKLGYEIPRRTAGFWQQWTNLEIALKELIICDKFPTRNLVYKTIGGGACRAIHKFGGIATVAKRMGYEPSYFFTTSDGHYAHSFNEFLFDEFLFSRGIPHETDGIIHSSSKYRYDFKIDKFYFEIWGIDINRPQKINVEYKKKRNKKEKVYKELQLTLVSIEHNIFKQPLKEIEKYFEKLMSELGFDISKKTTSLSDVVNHIEVWNENKILTELQKIINEIGHFPKHHEITKPGLSSAINKYGNTFYFAKKLGYDCKKPHRYWTEERITAEISAITQTIGHFPILKELKTLGYQQLASAISEYGGINHYHNSLH